MRDPEIITINGKQYDALTGKPIIKSVSDINQPKNNPNYRRPTGGGQIINDFARPVHHLVGPVPRSQGPVNNDVTAHNQHKKADDISRIPAKSNTLMRKPLKKPDFSTKTNPQPTHKSQYIRREGPMIVHRPIPAGSLRGTIINRGHAIKSTASGIISNISTDPPIASMNIHDRQIQKIETADEDRLYMSATKDIAEPKVTSKQKKSQSRRGIRAKTFYILVGIFLFFVILATTGFYFKNNIELAYDNAKAGINASTPNYMPLGYKLTNISYHKSTGFGEVSFEYNPGHSSLNLNFYLNESSSSLDNAGLLASDVIPLVHNNYSSFLSNGLTVYHFNNQYVWVNGGLLYIITDQTSLDQQTISKIITSI